MFEQSTSESAKILLHSVVKASFIKVTIFWNKSESPGGAAAASFGNANSYTNLSVMVYCRPGIITELNTM